MAKVDFAFGAADRLRTACQMVRKRYLAGHRLAVYCSDGTRLSAFDRMLWAFDDISFVPHVRADDPLAGETAVVLTASEPPAADWLVNLDDACPPNGERFTRILEIVSNDPQERQAARERWRHYQDQGHEVVAHDLGRKRE